MQVELTGGILAAAVALFSAGGAAIGWVFYKAYQTYRKLEKNDVERQSKAVQEEGQIRDQLLQKYKEMLEIERIRSERDLKELKEEVSRLRDEVHRLTDLQRTISEENEKLRILNLKLQRDALAKGT